MMIVRARSRRSMTGSYVGAGRLSVSDWCSIRVSLRAMTRAPRRYSERRCSSWPPAPRERPLIAHFIGGHEAKSLVERAARVGRVQHEAVELLLPGPADDLAHQCLGDAAPAPARLGVDVEDDSMAAFGGAQLAVLETERMREGQATLGSGPADHGLTVGRERDPRDVLAAGQGTAQPSLGQIEQGVVHLRCGLPHVAE